MPRVLLCTRTTDYRHDAIPAAAAAVTALLAEHGFRAEVTEDPRALEADLNRYACVVFLLTSGDILTETARGALRAYVEGGGGFAGVHSAACTEYSWPYFGDLLGARFTRHPACQPGRVDVVDRSHPAMQHLPGHWDFTDEWYDFDRHPAGAHVLAHADESSYDKEGGGMGGDGHPLVWCREQGAGRVFYTALGHAEEAYADDRFLAHLAGGFAWAAGRA
ncbi:ThuA domain-containing protein [Streptomyces sp. TRM66268-LWL]|uniref:ThuA domain-containing protein n=1 Tax=Streptomyces polyasparticus TaxID=2767826 RepID=A0ABR7SFC0_9ACTN|nr:ThuA domain-containing protein [Streptomyces polyasparticus]MBC9712993.1 ThuA domain-containing protein [Streptomyces polyasparticus]